ncbi:MAG TPA: ATP-dependent metallopeptidase FtsH/Yme1/Tma family protein, partial [Lysobacter sp.]|nr:ATP-dependent metallopeptidase FtsH/Yme1/Tma family protein [Lysobacter sp.]
MNDLAKNLLLWVIVAVVLMVVFQAFGPRAGLGATSSEVTYSQFMKDVKADRIKSVEYTDDTNLAVNALQFERKDGSKGTAYGPSDNWLVTDLLEHSVEITRKPPNTGPSFWSIVFNLLPILLIVGFWVFVMRQMQQGGSKGAMSFGKSRAKMQGEDQVKVTFADVAGCDEAKEEVSELVEFLRDPGKFQRLGGHIPRGVLMVGPPGTGKTLLSRAVAG